jgi:hypothetical protein
MFVFKRFTGILSRIIVTFRYFFGHFQCGFCIFPVVKRHNIMLKHAILHGNAYARRT